MLAATCALALLTACSAPADHGAVENKAANGIETSADRKEEGLQIVTSTFVLEDLTSSIVGDKGTVSNLMTSAEQGVHGFEPAAKDINRLNEADVFVYNGAGLESWADSVIETLDGEGLIVEASEGVPLIEGGHHHHDEEGEEHESEEDHGEGKDPHIWMSVKHARKMARNIADAVIEKDPENEASYEANFKALDEELAALDASFRESIEGAKRREIVVSHEAYGYLAEEYGLDQIPIEGINSETEPDPKAMKEIIDRMKEKGIQTIFTEPNEDDKIAQTVAGETGAKVESLDPLEYRSESSYIERMKANLEVLERALNE